MTEKQFPFQVPKEPFSSAHSGCGVFGLSLVFTDTGLHQRRLGMLLCGVTGAALLCKDAQAGSRQPQTCSDSEIPT